MRKDYIAIAYWRKSTEDKGRQVQSIQKQKDWSYERARQEGDEITYFYQDEKTAKKPGRENFGKMMEFIQKSNIPIKLYAWKTSRLARNAVDEGAIKYAIQEGKIKYVVTKERSYDEFTSQILLGVDFGDATQQSIDLSRDVTEGMAKKVEKGYSPQLVLNGWLNDPHGKQGDRKIFVDKERFPILQKEIFKILNSKGSYRLADSFRYLRSIDFKTKRGTRISKAVLHDLFTNSFIYGQCAWKGEVYMGIHKPMCTPSEFETLQIYISGRRSQERKHTNIFNGMIRCSECNCWITTEPPKIKRQKNGNVHVYHYMRCTKNNGTCSQKCIRLEKVEFRLMDTLLNIEIDPKFLEFCMKSIHRNFRDADSDLSKQREIFQKSYNENEEKITNLTEKYSIGKIDDEIYAELISRYKGKRIELERQSKSYGKNRDVVIEKFSKDIQYAKISAQRFKNGSVSVKKEIIQNLQSNLWLKDGKVVVELRSAFAIFARVNRLKSSIEPQKISLTKGELQIPSRWYAISDMIRTYLSVRQVLYSHVGII